jgi:hypothetical protein
MSRDIFVQDLPPGVATVDDIPDDFEPRSIDLRRADIIAAITEIAPYADFTHPAWGTIDLPGTTIVAADGPGVWLRGETIDVDLGDDELVQDFAFHLRGGGIEADRLVAKVLRRLKLRALDPSSDSGFFIDPDTQRD